MKPFVVLFKCLLTLVDYERKKIEVIFHLIAEEDYAVLQDRNQQESDVIAIGYSGDAAGDVQWRTVQMSPDG